MPEPELNQHDPAEPPPVAGGATKIAAPDTGSNAVVGHPHKRAHEAPDYFAVALDDAERLLKYAAEIGIDVDDNTRNSILEARATVSSGWNAKTAANLLAALTKLAAQLKPVTAESLRSFNTRPTVRTYWIVAICLAAFIVPFSLASFVSSAISQTIKADIVTANDLAVKLGTQFGSSGSQPPADAAKAAAGTASGSASSVPLGLSRVEVVTELQTFAASIRAIYARSRQLNWFIFDSVRDPFSGLRGDPAKYKSTFQLPVPLPAQLDPVATDRVGVYQDVRSFGQDVVDDVSVFYGAIATCILPVLYALLGTCAYLLRSFSQEMISRTFVPSHSDSARFLIAAIGGAVVGLFNNFTISQGASISPLAIAFLVGYAVDVFFSFLEGLIQAFTKNKGSSNVPAAPAPGAKV
jgi:hypothetical protein